VDDVELLREQMQPNYGESPFDHITEHLDVVLASAATIRQSVAVQHRLGIDELVEAIQVAWRTYCRHWLDNEHRQQLGNLADVDWSYHEPAEVEQYREEILAASPWATAGRRAWRRMARVVRRLAEDDRHLFNAGSSLASTIEGARTRVIARPLIVGLRRPPIAPETFVRFDGYLAEWVSPLLAQLLDGLRRRFGDLAGVNVDVSHDGYRRVGKIEYVDWVVARLLIFRHGLEQLLEGRPPQFDDLIEAWPPDDGWHFRLGECWFKGHRIHLSGQLFELLKAFAAARFPMGYAELKEKVWSQNDLVDERTIRGTLTLLRNALRKRFGWDDTVDPIPRDCLKPVTWKLDKQLFDGLPVAGARRAKVTP
jgi:hypothetical protein